MFCFWHISFLLQLGIFAMLPVLAPSKDKAYGILDTESDQRNPVFDKEHEKRNSVLVSQNSADRVLQKWRKQHILNSTKRE